MGLLIVGQDTDPEALRTGRTRHLFAFGQEPFAKALAPVVGRYREIAHKRVSIVDLIIIFIGNMGEDSRISHRAAGFFGNQDAAAMGSRFSFQVGNIVHANVGGRLQKWFELALITLQLADEAEQVRLVFRAVGSDCYPRCACH